MSISSTTLTSQNGSACQNRERTLSTWDLRTLLSREPSPCFSSTILGSTNRNLFHPCHWFQARSKLRHFCSASDSQWSVRNLRSWSRRWSSSKPANCTVCIPTETTRSNLTKSSWKRCSTRSDNWSQSSSRCLLRRSTKIIGVEGLKNRWNDFRQVI